MLIVEICLVRVDEIVEELGDDVLGDRISVGLGLGDDSGKGESHKR